jgi:membrane associated rhomboid family serine protease
MLAILAVYYFGGIFAGLFPQEKKTSWESHLFGFISGVVCAYIPNMLLYFIH